MRRSRLMLLILALGVWGWVGCEKVVLSELNCPEYGDATADLQSDLEMEEEVDLTPDDIIENDSTTVPASALGAPCDSDDDCNPLEGEVISSVRCLSASWLESLTIMFNPGLVPVIDFPGGMCSVVFCGSDADCGETALCHDAGLVFDYGSTVGLCANPCQTDADCRTSEGYFCFNTNVGDRSVCLPASLAPDVTAGSVGAACEADDDCDEGSCFTKESLNELYKTFDPNGSWEYEIPGGMCSNILCTNDSQCGDGGFCFNVGPLFDAGMDIGLCLRKCEDTTDCRYPEGYVCYFTGVEGEKACLPTTLVTDIPCGNGVCDTDLNESAETCPRDCE